ncbi:MAG: hypothetical protein D6689_03170 [Deltaproteobacteria bacterium]|nr:MAG: hypothetical protein D6689_03170 [Deltaproteobacteria bacterium]
MTRRTGWILAAAASTVAACAGAIDGAGPSPDGAVADAAGPGGADATPSDCPGVGPAYVHGDLWAFWHNYRVACDRQHKWLWICERRFGAGNCPVEAQRFADCWQATGDFPPSTWDGSTPAPSSPNWGVCQPHHWPEKNDPVRRPGNPVPCDTTQNDYDVLRTADPRYGVDWWVGQTSMRHFTIKVFEAGTDPRANNGQVDGITALSTHPGDYAAFMDGIDNHGRGCLPALTGDDTDPYPAQNFGAFAWVEVPADRPVTLAASWIGPIGDNIGTTCLNRDVYGFPPSFAVHSVDGKPWLVSSPCWDVIENVQLAPGRHYVWDLNGFRELPSCAGPPESVLSAVPEPERGAMRDGSCAGL